VVGAGRYELLRAGPRMARALEIVAELIHPEIARDARPSGGEDAP
jgi:hypothetical protein